MKLRQLSSLDCRIPVIGQGTMGIGGYFSPDATSDREYADALRMGIDLGMTLIDTAENYGGGHAEEIIGGVLEGRRDSVVVATKVSPEHLAYDDVIKACEGSLRRLRTDYLDLYQVHWPNPTVPIDGTMEAMGTLKEQGKIRAVGVSNFSLSQLQEAVAEPGSDRAVSNQVEYNLFDRSVERDMLPYCQQNGLILLAYSPLDQGGFAAGAQTSEVLRAISLDCGMTPAQIALNWLVSHDNVVAIPKATTPEHVRDNARAVDAELPPECLAAIDSQCQTRSVQVSTERIRVVPDGAGNRDAYQTLEAALENRLGFVPGPKELAEDMRQRDDRLKPVRVRRSSDASGRYEYDLVEGRVRFWGWVIAHGWDKPISVLIR